MVKIRKERYKNYSPLKPEDFTYSSDFHKEKTWGTDVVGGRATVSVKCKFGNETIRYTIKKDLMEDCLMHLLMDKRLVHLAVGLKMLNLKQ